jgi:hypothetical protein
VRLSPESVGFRGVPSLVHGIDIPVRQADLTGAAPRLARAAAHASDLRQRDRLESLESGFGKRIGAFR